MSAILISFIVSIVITLLFYPKRKKVGVLVYFQGEGYFVRWDAAKFSEYIVDYKLHPKDVERIVNEKYLEILINEEIEFKVVDGYAKIFK